MVYVLVIALFLIVLVFGATSVMSSYASAKQAEAVTEVARVAQINATGNLVVIVLVALVIVAALLLVAWMVKRSFTSQVVKPALRGPVTQQPAVDMNMLVQLETLRALRAMQQLPAPRSDALDEPESAEMLYWLRQ